MLCGLFFGALWHTNNEETLGRKAPARCLSFATNYFFQGLPPCIFNMSLLIVTHCWNILFCAVVSVSCFETWQTYIFYFEKTNLRLHFVNIS